MKRTKLYILASMLLLSVSGCSNSSSADQTTVSTQAEAAFSVTVKDHAGRTVTINKKPESIVSGYYISSSLLIALGLEDKMVGIEAKADKRAIYKLAAPDLTKLPSVGSAKEFDLEGCIALSPDLVILPLKLRDNAGIFQDMGINVLFVNPENKDQVIETVSMIAKATGTDSEGEALISYITSAQDKVTAATKDLDKPSVYLAGNSSLLSTAGKEMYQSTLIELAGGTNVAADIAEKYWSDISYEQLVTWNPDYIIMASDASYTVDDVLSDSNLSDCNAVKNKQVYVVPGDIEALDSPVPASILASYWLAGILHPDSISADTYTTERNSYYETFYKFEVKDN